VKLRGVPYLLYTKKVKLRGVPNFLYTKKVKLPQEKVKRRGVSKK
jgi:hypothetical protein